MMTEQKDDIQSGTVEIDRQHRELVDTANHLFDAVKHGRGPEEIRKILGSLEAYMMEHFSLEEKYMDRSLYPGAEEHKKSHAAFADEFLKMEEEFRRKEDSSYIMLMFGGWLYKWLHEHFAREDKALVDFLKNKT